MIEKIKFENFKNKKGTQKLTGFDLFVGANGVGKSSVIEAIELALLGKIKNRQTPKDIFKLSSDDNNMSVKLDIDLKGEELSVARTFKKKERADGTKTFSQALNVNFSDATSIKEQEEAMEKVFGTMPVSFDFNSFSSLSNREKKDFILSFSSKRPVFTEEEFRELMENAMVTLAEPGLDKPILKGFTDDMVKHIVGLSEKDEILVLEALDTLLEETKDKVSYFRKDLDRTLKTQQKLTDKRNDMGIAPVKISFDEKVLEKKREMLSEANSKLNSLAYTQNLLSKEMEKKRRLMDEIDSLNRTAGIDKTPLEDLIAKKQEDLTNLNEKYRLIEKEKEEVTDLIAEAKKSIEVNRNNFIAYKEEGIKLKEKIKNEEALLSKVKATDGKCVINASIPCHEDFGSWITAKESDILILNKNLDTKRKDFEELTAKLKLSEKEYEALHEKQRSLNSESNLVVTTSNQLNRDINGLMKKLEEALSFDKVKSEKLSNLSANLSEAVKNADTFQDEVNKLNAVVSPKTVEDLREDIKSISETLEKKKEAALLTTQIEESFKEYEKAQKSFEGLKYMQNTFLVLKTKIFEDLIKPVAIVINNNLSNMGYHKFYGNIEEQEFNFGLINGKGEKIPFEALSTGQQAVLSICMVASFIENSNTNLKVFAIDNVENIDYENFEKVIRGLEIIRPKFDNIVLSGCLTEIPLSGTVELWNL